MTEPDPTQEYKSVITVLPLLTGALGFMSNGKNTGNFGLWDQIAALQWIQRNIEYFGGDKDRVGGSSGSDT